MSERAFLWAKVKIIAGWFIVIALIMTTLIGVVAMLQLQNIATYVQQMKKSAKVYHPPQPVPTEAKTKAELFTGVWLSPVDQDDPQKKIQTLSPYITPDFRDFLTLNTNVLATTTDQFRVYRTDVFGDRWVQEGKLARVKVRVLTTDGRMLYFECPVKKSGAGWGVDQLPSLVSPSPMVADKEKQEDINLSESEVKALKDTLNNFLEVWVKGEQEAVRRYTLDNKPIPTANILQGQYLGVQNVIPRHQNGDSYVIQVLVNIQDKSQTRLTLSYDVTVRKQDDQWFIESINKED